MAQQLNGSLLQAVLEGREGYTHLEDAVRLRPDLADAQMGFGIFRYLTAKVPRGQSWIISLLGFDSDAEGGMQSLRLAADRGIYARSEANFYLAQFLFNEQKHEEAFSRLAWLRAHHPENTLFHVLAASWHFRLNNYDSALAALRWASVINDRKTIKYGEEFIYSTRGSIQFTRNNFDGARRDFDLFLAKVAQRDRIPNYTLYRIALAREIAGDRKGAVDACSMARESAGGDRGRDSYQLRKLRELAARPLTAAEILLVQANNASSRKEIDSSVAYYTAALAVSGSDSDAKARALYGLQQIKFERGDFAGAISDGQQAVAVATPRETWVAPQAYLKIAQSLAKLGKKKEALEALRKIEDFDDYDFQKSVEERAEEERESIEKEN
jgi:tetratricopeptide (TPR) repeat protein